MNETVEKARDFREGFCEGAHAVVKAIGDDLPDVQLRVLQKWIDGPLAAWRHADADAPEPPLPLLDGA